MMTPEFEKAWAELEDALLGAFRDFPFLWAFGMLFLATLWVLVTGLGR